MVMSCLALFTYKPCVEKHHCDSLRKQKKTSLLHIT